jgi:hypothetical protein
MDVFPPLGSASGLIMSIMTADLDASVVLRFALPVSQFALLAGLEMTYCLIETPPHL